MVKHCTSVKLALPERVTPGTRWAGAGLPPGPPGLTHRVHPAKVADIHAGLVLTNLPKRALGVTLAGGYI